MPRVAKPKAAKSKAAKKEESPVAASSAASEDLSLSPPAAPVAHVETDESAARYERRPRAAAPVVEAPPDAHPESAEAPKEGGSDHDTDMVLRPPTRPVETTETLYAHARDVNENILDFIVWYKAHTN